MHAVTEPRQAGSTAEPEADLSAARTTATPKVGFVVSKAVGNAVVRHRVARRLRHMVRERVGTLPPGSALVVRALPSAAVATSAELGQDFDAAIRRLRLVDDGDRNSGGSGGGV